ncbi:MAG: type II toxin-antitoxin system VapC family toxin [Thermodesulfobacteriota bacterium]
MVVLDTNAWLAWVDDPSRLSKRARSVIRREEAVHEIIVSAASAWEIAIKVAIHKLGLTRPTREWVAAAAYPGIEIRPVSTPEILESCELPPGMSRDPFDRLIVGLARHLGVPVVTSDEAMRRYPHVRTIW